MPFKSKKQRKWMHANKPKMAKKWEKEEAKVQELVVNPAVLQQFKDRAIAAHGKKVKISTALGNKSHPAHKRAKSLLQKFKDRFKKKKKAAPKKQTKSDADFYKRQFAGESINERSDSRAKKTLMRALKNSKVADVWSYDNDQIVIEMTSPSKENFIVGNIQSYNPNESINEAIKVRGGETPMEGKWGVYDNSTGKAIKEVGSARAATRLMNRLMSSGQYKEVAAKWIGELVNEASSWGQVKTTLISIIKRKQHQKIDGFLVDMQTANVILKVGNALNQSNQKKFGKLPINKMATVAWKLVK